MEKQLATEIVKQYTKAFNAGTSSAWISYRRWLNKKAVEVDASSPEALEDWAITFVDIL